MTREFGSLFNDRFTGDLEADDNYDGLTGNRQYFRW
jgi:hypothetical protein